ncbi:dihydropteroate synthase [Pseudidiomarina terrestris]|uniref:Dihydropteroate synthase n=1 Tax=Pseudidiomarina terrestris TaxID=2820060 RepID=A0AAW7QX37_9GAMM|nr:MULTISPECIES: dihydropteroate synthase [unclassified Pseudidiomarina]MDN7123317.1 dihydropteroate synthase [Pseudidiomarina sp. 1APP75-32.1]MDN7127851.1 dihydropteroate synthase [Pseudidiomarina sp. 1APR75-33.1]MDN7128958.1 dihydropteroate synthase [Pseudidiomarina sp. 1APR75-15]MDN7134779.1 dihydropteroate synthase [Pseudidiomarina sp. 1ASP75-5]MDN7137457.1 dihydropteroate synthase [Pseudidiomarina sp. 1ASP75-14]
MAAATALPKVMGILNVTPDSFSDGGRFNSVDRALQQAEQMIADGADYLDIGGESTRPGADAVSVQEEIDRVMPVIARLRQEFDVALSLDTCKTAVMAEGLNQGIALVNDIRALRDEGALALLAQHDVDVCLMHMQGEPRTMQHQPRYEDVVIEVKAFLQQRIRACDEAGIARERIYLDPGFGFGKSVRHNYQLLQRMQALHELQLPLLVGVSRKSMLGHVTGREVEDRLPASLAAATIAAMKGARIIRVHDVRETVDAMKVVAATLAGDFS